jgi:hypothetical protein
MLRFLLKIITTAWFIVMLCLLATHNFGKTAPEISKVAFVSQEIEGSDYWRLDLFTGVAFKDEYSERIFVPEIYQGALPHFLAVRSDANYSYVSDLNLYNQQQRYLTRYPARDHFLVLAGDFVFIVDRVNQWRRFHTLNPRLTGFGLHPNLSGIRVSPDGQWIAGQVYTLNWMVINAENGSSYEIEPYAYMIWSPNSQWFLVGNYQTASVLNAADGSIVLGDIPARLATWSSDGQSLVIQYQGRLVLLDVASGETTFTSTHASSFWLQCLSPNRRYILSHDNQTLRLLDVAANTSQWEMPLEDPAVILCEWSADNRYLRFYIISDQFERFFLVDTWTRWAWDSYPATLPTAPVYLHIPE